MERRDVLAFRQAAAVLPLRLRQRALALPLEEQGLVEELRLRAGRPLSAVLPEGERSLGGGPVSSAELEQLVEIASRASLHTVLPQICQGYLTIEGGHRLGLCGTAVLREGEIHSLRRLSSANLRVARQVMGAAETVLSRRGWARPPCCGTWSGWCPKARAASPCGCRWPTSGERWPPCGTESPSWMWAGTPMWWRAAPRPRD